MANVSQADIKLKNQQVIEIKIERAPENTTISELKERIQQVEEVGLDYTKIDLKLKEYLEEMDVVDKAQLLALLEDYPTTAELHSTMSVLLASERAYNDGRYLQKAYVTQAQYDAMSDKDKKENTIYVIR